MLPLRRILLPLFPALAVLASCGAELDSRGAERLQFYKSNPPNIKTDYEVILGNLEAQKYKEIHGPVKRILQRNYEIAKDGDGELLAPHFSGTVEINYLPTGEIADFSSFDGAGSLTKQALVIHKANRREIYMHLFESRRDFVYYLENGGRIIEEANPFYSKSPVDGSWNSADGHFSWEENKKRQIVAAFGRQPSVSYRHLYKYGANDSLVQIQAFNNAEKKIGEMNRIFNEKGLLEKVEFHFDERPLHPNDLNYTEDYRYDSLDRLTSVITGHNEFWGSRNDTLSIVYQDKETLSEKDVYRHGDLESRTIYDTLGNATLIETFGSFIYEGANGTAESYDVERSIRTIEYYGQKTPAHLADSLEKPTSAKKSPTSLSANEFFRHEADSTSLICSSGKKSVVCRQLKNVPGTIFLNFIESVNYKNASEVFLERSACAESSALLLSKGKCAMVLCQDTNQTELLFESSLVTFKRNPYPQFLGDTVSFSKKDFPCDFK